MRVVKGFMHNVIMQDERKDKSMVCQKKSVICEFVMNLS